MLGEEAERNQVVRLTATHCLGQLEDGLFGFAREPTKRLRQQSFHALGDVVFLEERAAVDLAVGEMREVENCIASRAVEECFPRLAKLLERFHEACPTPERGSF